MGEVEKDRERVESAVSMLDEACEKEGVTEETGDSVLIKDVVPTLLVGDVSETTGAADGDRTALPMDGVTVPVGVRTEVSVGPVVTWEEEMTSVKWGFIGSLEEGG